MTCNWLAKTLNRNGTKASGSADFFTCYLFLLSPFAQIAAVFVGETFHGRSLLRRFISEREELWNSHEATRPPWHPNPRAKNTEFWVWTQISCPNLDDCNLLFSLILKNPFIYFWPPPLPGNYLKLWNKHGDHTSTALCWECGPDI